MNLRFSLFLCCCLAAFSVAAEKIFFHEPFDSEKSIKQYSAWQVTPELFSEPDGSRCMKLHREDRADHATLTIPFQANALAGQWVEVSAMFRGENIAPAQQPYNGAKFMLPVKTPKTTHYFGVQQMKRGSFDWERTSFREFIPADATEINLILGFQDSFGSLFIKDLKVKSLGAPLNLENVANMGFADKTAADGKGGWSDQGPDNDASKFKPTKNNLYAGIPFRLINPEKNDGKAVLSMKSSSFPNGIEEAVVSPNHPVNASHLYLLHTVCHATKGSAGVIEVTGENGAMQTIPIEIGRDIADWWNPKRVANAYPAALWNNSSSGDVGIYASKFKLDPGISPVKSVKFRSINSIPVWIILGATLSETNHNFPDAVESVVKENEKWRPLPPAQPGVIEGSALDRSALTTDLTITEKVTINSNGQLALAGSPDTPVRFLTLTDSYHSIFELFKTKEDIEAYTRQLRLQGYNMARLHYLDDMLMHKASKPLVFNQMILDRFQYYVYCMKKNVIYLNLDAMCSRYGYEVGKAWENDGTGRDYGYDIYFKEDARDNWRQGVKQLLTQVNPYTNTSLADDPVLAIVNGSNEQEFAMMEWKYPKNAHYMLPSWRDFLKQKYRSIDAYNTTWKSQVKNWDEIPLFTAEESRARNTKGTDIALYKSDLESRQYEWYVDELKNMGYHGVVTNYDMGQSMRYIALRKNFQAIGIHSYHAHPTVFGKGEETIDQSSAIGNSNTMFRGINSTQMTGKPLLVTEYGVVFWNQYRYEEAFTMGAYSAFQDHSALTVHAQPVSTRPQSIILPFRCSADPIIHASEFLTAYLFRRGDVAPAKAKIRLDLNTEAMFRDGTFHDGIHYGQSRLCLLTGVSTAVDPDFPVRKNELALSTAGGSTVMTRPGYTMVVDQPGAPFDIDAVIGEFKKQKLVPQSNRTKAANEIFENSNNELYLNARKNFMSVNTPKLQGICAEAGTEPVAFNDLAISNLTTRGNVAAVSVDDKPLNESERIVLVYATNALNTEMVFLAEDMRVLKSFGKAPILVETGGFEFRLTTQNADRLKLYALATDGSRRFEIPLQRKNDSVNATIDTASFQDGPSLYFELAVN